MILVLLLYALFASIFTVSKEALFYSEPFFLVGIRMVPAGIFMLLFQYWKHPESLKFQPGTGSRLLQLALFHVYLTNVLEFWGLQYLTSFKTCFLYSLSPFISALFSYLMFHEKMTSKKWIGLSVGFLGFIPVLIGQSAAGEDVVGSLLFFSWPELAVITAVIASVYGWILLKQLSQHDGYSPLVANGYSMVLGGIFALCHSGVSETWDPIPATNITVVLQCSLFLILVSNCICYNLYGYLLRRFSATFMSFAGLTTVLFTVLFGWFFFGEKASITFYISYVVVFLGLAIFYQEELKVKAKEFLTVGRNKQNIESKKRWFFSRFLMRKLG